jgi:hypothetical protein
MLTLVLPKNTLGTVGWSLPKQDTSQEKIDKGPRKPHFKK